MHASVHAIRKIPVKYQCNQLRFWQGFSSWKDDTKKWPRHCRLCHKGNTEQRASEHPTGRSLEQKCLEVTAACAHEERQRGAPWEEVWGEPVHTRPQGSEGNTNTMLNLKEIQLLEKAERFSSWRTANNCATCKGTPASRRKNCYSAAVWVTFKHYIPSDKRQILEVRVYLREQFGIRKAMGSTPSLRRKVKFIFITHSCIIKWFLKPAGAAKQTPTKHLSIHPEGEQRKLQGAVLLSEKKVPWFLTNETRPWSFLKLRWQSQGIHSTHYSHYRKLNVLSYRVSWEKRNTLWHTGYRWD